MGDETEYTLRDFRRDLWTLATTQGFSLGLGDHDQDAPGSSALSGTAEQMQWVEGKLNDIGSITGGKAAIEYQTQSGISGGQNEARVVVKPAFGRLDEGEKAALRERMETVIRQAREEFSGAEVAAAEGPGTAALRQGDEREGRTAGA